MKNKWVKYEFGVLLPKQNADDEKENEGIDCFFDCDKCPYIYSFDICRHEYSTCLLDYY